MSEETKNMLVPKLRFPEFDNEGEWEEKSLNKVCEVNPSIDQLPERFVYIDLESVEDGVLLQKKIIQREEAPSRAQRLLKAGDVIFQMVRPYQKNNYFFQPDDDLDYVASTGYAQLRAYQSNMYLFQYLHNQIFVDKVLEKCTGSNYPAINSSDLAQILIEIPNLKEQQKIASCLSSLDELITVQSQKLEALKAHKKGLMQQLFPAEGETVPRLRFKEFEGSGEWEEKRLGDFAKVVASGDLDLTSFSSIKSETYAYPVYSNAIENEGLYGFYSSFKYTENSITITARGNLGFAFLRKSKFMGIGRLIIVNNLENIEPNFLKECWNHLVRIPQEVTSIPQLTAIAAKAIELPIPSDIREQQKISDCLSSLDELITAQAEKIEKLRRHKKGLMQGLFPKVSEP